MVTGRKSSQNGSRGQFAKAARPVSPSAPASLLAPASGKYAVTMSDIAGRLGVSKMTVSRALSGATRRRSPASEALRQQILATCHEMGYVVDQTARSFSSKRSGFIAAVIPALNNSNFSDTTHGLTAAVESAAMQVLLGHTDYDTTTEERLIRTLLMRRPEGIVVTGGSHTPTARRLLESAGVPVVETWDMLERPIDHNVGFSNAQACRDLVMALHAQGYRRIGFLGGLPDSDARGADRRRGYVQAMSELQLDPSPSVTVGLAPVSMEAGAQGVVQLIERWPDLEAVVCVSDHAAFGALSECQRRNWSVPARLAIAGFGGFEVGLACHPQLTTVSVDSVGIGRVAGELLIRAVEASRQGKRMPSETVLMPYRIEIRGSTQRSDR